MLCSRCTGNSYFSSVIENTDEQFHDCYGLQFTVHKSLHSNRKLLRFPQMIVQSFSPLDVINSICNIGRINVQTNIFYILFMSL